MNRNQRRRKARRVSGLLLKLERQYYRAIRSLYTGWLNEQVKRLSELTGYRLDAEEIETTSVAQWADAAVIALGSAVVLFSNTIRDYATRVINTVRSLWTGAAPSASPIFIEPWIERQIADFAYENAQLITKLGRDTVDRIAAATLDNYRNARGASSLAAEIRRIDGAIGQNRANLIARDQLGSLTNNATRAYAQNAGMNRYEWQTMGDSRVRPKHRELNGSIREYGNGLEPGDDIGCRCLAIPIRE